MSADKRALDDLDALFRTVPSKGNTLSRPNKKLRNGGMPGSSLSSSKVAKTAAVGSAAKRKRATEPPEQEVRMTAAHHATYSPLPPAILPRGLMAAASTPRSKRGAIGVAAALRLTDFVRGVLGARGDRAAAAAIETRLQRRVVHLENVSAQTEAQSAGARAARAGGRVKQGLSGKQCKRKGLTTLKAAGGKKLSFRDFLGLHEIWKGYAERVVSRCGSNQKLLQRRIHDVDFQGCYLTVSKASASSLVDVAGIVLRETANTFQLITPESKVKTVPKRGCALRLALGGVVVDVTGTVLEGRRGRQKCPGLDSDAKRASTLQTTAL